MADQLKILFVTPEIVPYAATGGLADVGEALPYALMDEKGGSHKSYAQIQGN